MLEAEEHVDHRAMAAELLKDRLYANGVSVEYLQQQMPTTYLSLIGLFSDIMRKEGINQLPQGSFADTYHVMQDWTSTISHRQQGVMVMALRGPDGLPKESGCKNVIRSFRASVMNSGDTKKPLALGEALLSKYDKYMTMEFLSIEFKWKEVCEAFVSDIDTYNIHFLQHFLHAAMVVAFNHPNETMRARWEYCANRIAKKLHIHLETKEEFTHRLRDGVRTVNEELA